MSPNGRQAGKMKYELPFSVALVGAGAISRAAHVPAILASSKARVGAIVDPSEQRARALRDLYGLNVPIYAEVSNIDVPIDAAVVAVPNHLHAPVATSLLDANIPVLVEKPLATTAGDAQSVIAAASARGCVIAVGFHTRHSGACRALCECVRSQMFGEVLSVAHQDGSIGGWAPASAYNLDRRQAGGGVLVSTGTHCLDRLIWMLGFPESAAFYDDSEGGPESHCTVHCGMTSHGRHVGVSATFSKVLDMPENTVVETTEGLLLMQRDSADYVEFLPAGDTRLRYTVRPNDRVVDPRSLYQRQLEEFIEACRGNRATIATGEDGLKVVQLVEKLYEIREPLTANVEMAATPT